MALAEVMGRLLRNKKLLKSVNKKAKKKTECLKVELEEILESPLPEDVFVDHYPTTATTVGLSPLT